MKEAQKQENQQCIEGSVHWDNNTKQKKSVTCKKNRMCQ